MSWWLRRRRPFGRWHRRPTLRRRASRHGARRRHHHQQQRRLPQRMTRRRERGTGRAASRVETHSMAWRQAQPGNRTRLLHTRRDSASGPRHPFRPSHDPRRMHDALDALPAHGLKRRSPGNDGDRFLALDDRELCGFSASATVLAAVKTQRSASASAEQHRRCLDRQRSPARLCDERRWASTAPHQS